MVFKHLKGVRGDCTFKQTQPFQTLPKEGPYYSMDLSAATDRFPVAFQKLVVEKLTGRRDYAEAWERIMVKEPFSYKGSTYTYSVGQPMGLYSSWAIFALSHHIIVRIAANRANLGFG